MQKSAEKGLLALEGEYRAALLTELRACVDGHYGLFGQNDAALARAGLKRRAPDVDASLQLGDEIGRLRSRLGYEPFALHAHLVAMRAAPRHGNMPGEPKLAQQWLDELTGGAVDQAVHNPVHDGRVACAQAPLNLTSA